VAATTLVVALGRLGRSAQAAEACKDVTPAPQSRDPYQLIDKRCEGMYLERYAASVVPHSVTIGNVVVPDAETVTLAWEKSGARQTLDLVARDVRCEPHYQMRTTVLAADGTFAWPTRILRRNSVRELGIRARSEAGTYIPTRLGAVPVTSGYRVAFCTSEPLVDVWIKIYDRADEVVHKASHKRAKAGPVSISIPHSKLTTGETYRATLTSGAISSELQFELK
jgi:hypothetical protein